MSCTKKLLPGIDLLRPIGALKKRLFQFSYPAARGLSESYMTRKPMPTRRIVAAHESGNT